MLTDKEVKAFKADGTTQKKPDGNGLYLWIRPGGKKIWISHYSINRKQDDFQLGVYPAMPLAQARKKNLEIRELIASGLDPRKEQKRIAAQASQEAFEKSNTFRKVATEWLETRLDNMAAGTNKKNLVQLEKLYNVIGDFPIKELRAASLLPLLRAYEDQNKGCMAHELARLAGQIGAYAFTAGYADFNFAFGLTKILKPVKSRHHPCLTDPREVGLLLRNIDNYHGSLSILFALKVLPYVPLRNTELRAARWNEIDFDKALWTVPASRADNPKDGGGMKTRRQHEIPLSRQALAIFQELKDFHLSDDLCFPSERASGRPITDAGFRASLLYMGYPRDKLNIHGLR